MDRNPYLEILLKSIDQNKGITTDSIENLLSNMTDLHNTIGKSYECFADVLSGLVKKVNENKFDNSATKKMREYENHILDLKAKVIGLEEDLKDSHKRTKQIEIECNKKNEEIHELRDQLERAQQERTVSTGVSKNSSVFKKSAVKKLEDLLETPPKDLDSLEAIVVREPVREEKKEDSKKGGYKGKRKFDQISKSDVPELNGIFEEDENSRGSTTSQNRRGEENSNSNFDDYKFKKAFKKVKRNENSRENTTSTPITLNLNGKKKEDMVTMKKPTELNFDDENSLQNLLNNFIDIPSNSANPKDKKKDSMQLDSEMLLPASLSADDAFNMQNSKTYRKSYDMAVFSQNQKSPLKDLDLPLEPLSSQVPLTKGGKSDAGNLMKKMLNANKKRNQSGSFRMSANTSSIGGNFKENQEPSNKYEKKYNDEDLFRAAYRSKAEREELQGFDCNQCKQFYDYVTEGIQKKSAADHCDKCSRHKDKFPLPQTPEIFHNNFSLNSQDF